MATAYPLHSRSVQNAADATSPSTGSVIEYASGNVDEENCKVGKLALFY